jgi:hypothetical protein
MCAGHGNADGAGDDAGIGNAADQTAADDSRPDSVRRRGGVYKKGASGAQEPPPLCRLRVIRVI